jgi:hypothetical protein
MKGCRFPKSRRCISIRELLLHLIWHGIQNSSLIARIREYGLQKI